MSNTFTKLINASDLSKVSGSLKIEPNEIGPLSEFRERVYKLYPFPDAKLIAWLRARNLSVDKAEQMLRRHLIWRKNNEVSKLLLWESPKNFFPFLQSGFDHEGAPVAILPIGQWDLKGTIEMGDMIPALKFVYQTLEILVSAGVLVNLYQGTIICDFDGFTYSQIAHRTVIQGIIETVRVFEANYPEVLKACYIINAPVIFNMVFQLVKPILNSRTLSKIQIFRNDPPKWQAVIFDHMDKSQIPPHWGGTRPGSDEFCSEDWLMSPLPPYYFKKISTNFDEYGDEWWTVKIGAGEHLLFKYTVEDVSTVQTKLTWAFWTESGYDVEFALLYNEDQKYVIGKKKISATESKPEKGSFQIQRPGTYVLTFDNSYSRARSKTIHYFLALESESIESSK